ncbi:ARF GTPase-activating protein GIT1 [Dermatophagoides pteronyssinus]|uniref:ARF GTPase-activating protein GIT1 n=1 Tax=Dermatophagoides pteronyssinus TaxID=6956 RepID=UPI003F665E90
MPKTTYSQMLNNEIDVCADCSQINPTWASINHGTLLCDHCAIIHRSLGRIISQIKPINSNNWKSTQLQMVLDLYRSGSNSIWEHTLLDPHVLSSGNHHQATHNKIHQRKKPQPNDPLHPNKSDFIRAKYHSFAFVNKSHGIKDDVESEADISEQLHSSVRTPNLKTSLRLLVAGANPNYIHSEKFNSPLHMAARSGQMSQIELLLAYGANSTIVDSRNKSAIDYARDAGYHDIFYRLIEHQFDLTDTLTRFICQGRQPNHRNGEHFLFVDVKSEWLNHLDNINDDGNNNNETRNSTEVFRNELHQSLQSLGHKLFQELTRDVYDELDRREINAFVLANYFNENGKLSILHQQLIIPFLPVYQYFSTTRNQGRQKLALLNNKELTLLIVDVLNEVRRRVYNIEYSSGSLNNKSTGKEDRHENENDDSEPLYDSVPSEEEYEDLNFDNELNTIVNNRNKQNQNNTQLKSSNTAIVQEGSNHVSTIEYNALKEQIVKSTELMESFVNENRTMRLELNRLQTKLDKLAVENLQLRQFILTPSSSSANPSMKSSFMINEPKSTSMLIESSEDLLNSNNNIATYLHNQPTTNRVRPQSMSTITNDFSSQSMAMMSMMNKSPVSFNHASPSGLSLSPSNSMINYNNPNNQRNLSPHNYNMIFNSNNNSNDLNDQRLHHSSFIDSSSSLSSQLQQTSNNRSSSSPHSQHHQPTPTLKQPSQTNQTNLNEMRPYTNATGTISANTSLSKSSASKTTLPTKDEVIRKIEFITNGIKELLIKAKEEKHNEFHHCSERICNYVSDMINLFPESIESSNMDNLLQLNQAFTLLQGNVIHLNELCHSYQNRPSLRYQHSNSTTTNHHENNRYNYNKVIDKAAEVASSVKSIINLYNIQATTAAAIVQ